MVSEFWPRAHGGRSVWLRSQTGADKPYVHTRPPLSDQIWLCYAYQFGSDPFRSRGDARIRSRFGADVRRGLLLSLNARVFFTHQEASFDIHITWERIHISDVHSGPVWIGFKREKIQNGSAPVCTKPIEITY